MPEATTDARESEGQPAWPLVTVNVLAFNRRRELATTLTVLRQELDYPPDRLEVVVVDNASTDGTAEMLARDFPEVEVVRKPANVGISGWNAGFARARGEFVLVLDDDCYLNGDGLKRAVLAARADQADLVSFRVTSAYDRDFLFNRYYDPGLLAFWGCSALLSRRALERLHGFDPSIFLWAHEAEFTIRLLDEGLCHVFLPEVISVHIKEPPGRSSASRRQTNLRNLAYIAVRSLRPGHAVGAMANLALGVMLAAARQPAAARDLWSLGAGVRAGLAARRPVRRSVSALYRRNFIDFVSPLRFVRRPWALVGEGGRDPIEDLAVRRAAFWRRRERLYPEWTASIRLQASGMLNGAGPPRTPGGPPPAR